MAQGTGSVRLIEHLRGVGVRVAALSALLVIASMALLGALVYALIDDALQIRVRRLIEEEMATLLVLPLSGDRDWLIDEIRRRTNDGLIRRYAYRIVSSDGTYVVGDTWLTQSAPGWSIQDVPETVEATIGAGHLLVLTVAADRNLLISIGRDVRWIGDVETELLELLLWSLLGGIGLAVLTSIVVQRMVAQRLALVSRSAQAIMDGNLEERIPLTGANDDFDRLSRTLNEMLDRIQGLMNNLEQVTNDIAHDLRTPLGRLRQGLERARAEAKTPQAYGEAIDRAIVEADGLLATFTALLRIAQIEAGARHSAFRALDLSEVVRSVAEAYEPSGEERGQRIVLDIAAGMKILGDRDLLSQAFANLIENALTHTPSGTLITVSTARTDAGVMAAVSDNGPGVPDEERDRIFDRFYRREASRTTPGTGLGLSLAAAVARLHGAHIDAANAHPGLRVSLTFPEPPRA